METLKNVQDYITLIDSKFAEAKRTRVSRFDPKWGIWSRKMNLKIRKQIDSTKNIPDKALLKSILPYWIVVSELLELHHKSKLTGSNKKKKLAKERKVLRDDILGGNATSELSIQDLAVRALKMGKK